MGQIWGVGVLALQNLSKPHYEAWFYLPGAVLLSARKETVIVSDEGVTSVDNYN